MTFKHVKFEDSVVMRSLEKLAKDKGLVKSEEITKTAAPKLDLSPSGALINNVLKLCEGLRQSGLIKHADDLEEKFINYKQAQTLYEAHSEKGEDLIDRAHPKGSHHLEDVEGDEAVIETILDQQLKALDMIKKVPTGKLSNASSIIDAVKVVLAQSPLTVDSVKQVAREVVATISTIDSMTGDELTVSLSNFVSHAQKLAENPTVYNLKEMKALLNRLYKRLDPSISGASMGLGGVSDYTWNRLQNLLSKANNLVEKAVSLRVKLDQSESESASLEGHESPESGGQSRTGETVVMNAEGKQFISQVNNYLSQLSGFQVAIENDPENSAADKSQANAWIYGKINALNGLKQQFLSEQDQTVQNNKAAGFLSALGKNVKDFAKFKSEWIG
jgi:hypothetical protein